ncbi:SGNH/GDSL hydrolase family protein [Bullifex porci]|uniref:SGNH/GDSL hydrolase family protein n=1 Tax=Bullifex porci TaxID=2606638 RepID=UPI0023F4A3B4|nr:SGNH/GDSL hydrolase family protein [Bullifex porci]MDD7254466.1 SGNH/GDSL hydrolase family protein [Bullifex porci]MDY2742101.1 SGNH/GDSL hydrolase family protein [Bullifex porci]
MKLTNKIVSFLGDSITEGVGVSNIELYRFDNLIKQRCGCKRVNNYGISGTRIAHKTQPTEKARHDMNFCGRCFDMDKESDVIIVFGGVNDYLHGDAPLGKLGDKGRDTFCGSVDYLTRTIREEYPNATLVFFTPAHCYCDDGYSQIKPEGLIREEHLLSKFREAIIKIAPNNGFYVFDMAKELEIDPKLPEDKEKYTVDGLHFNDVGNSVIADVMIKCIETI